MIPRLCSVLIIATTIFHILLRKQKEKSAVRIDQKDIETLTEIVLEENIKRGMTSGFDSGYVLYRDKFRNPPETPDLTS